MELDLISLFTKVFLIQSRSNQIESDQFDYHGFNWNLCFAWSRIIKELNEICITQTDQFSFILTTVASIGTCVPFVQDWSKELNVLTFQWDLSNSKQINSLFSRSVYICRNFNEKVAGFTTKSARLTRKKSPFLPQKVPDWHQKKVANNGMQQPKDKIFPVIPCGQSQAVRYRAHQKAPLVIEASNFIKSNTQQVLLDICYWLYTVL